MAAHHRLGRDLRHEHHRRARDEQRRRSSPRGSRTPTSRSSSHRGRRPRRPRRAAQADATGAQLTSLADTAHRPLRNARRCVCRSRSCAPIALNPSAGAYQVDPGVGAHRSAAGPASSRTPAVDAVIAGRRRAAPRVSAWRSREPVRPPAAPRVGRRVELRVPVLAVLPHVSRTGANGRRTRRRSTRVRRDAPQPARQPPAAAVMERRRGRIVVTSALPGEGKSTVAAHLALVCVESGERVLLIDADLRRPSIAEWFGVERDAGLHAGAARRGVARRGGGNPARPRASRRTAPTGMAAPPVPTVLAPRTAARSGAMSSSSTVMCSRPGSAARREGDGGDARGSEHALRHCDRRHGADPGGCRHRADARRRRCGAARRAPGGHDAETRPSG